MDFLPCVLLGNLVIVLLLALNIVRLVMLRKRVPTDTEYGLSKRKFII